MATYGKYGVIVENRYIVDADTIQDLCKKVADFMVKNYPNKCTTLLRVREGKNYVVGTPHLIQWDKETQTAFINNYKKS